MTQISEKLSVIYDEMRTRQRKCILESGEMRSDQFFLSDPYRKDDDRRCLAISAIIDNSVKCEWTESFYELEDELTQLNALRFGLCPEDMAAGSDDSYDGNSAAGQLHWTLMQLVGFADYDTVNDPKNPNSDCTSTEYLNCVQDWLTVGGLDSEITIEYTGVVCVSTGLLMVGIPNIDVNEARDTLRSKLAEKNLPLAEPFVNDIVHSTLFRVTEQADPDLHHRLLDLAKKYENVTLGKITLKNLQVGPASWRMLSHEVDATPPLRQWTLSSNTPQEDYQNRLLSNQDTQCYTVSGVSGLKLATEVKHILESRSSSKISDDDSCSTAPTDSIFDSDESFLGGSSPKQALVDIFLQESKVEETVVSMEREGNGTGFVRKVSSLHNLFDLAD